MINSTSFIKNYSLKINSWKFIVNCILPLMCQLYASIAENSSYIFKKSIKNEISLKAN